MKKIYVLDTNILIADSEAPSKFDEHIVVLPVTVTEELDKLKKSESGEVAYNARRAIKSIKKVTNSKNTALPQTDGEIRFAGAMEDLAEQGLDMKSNDNKIIATAMYLKKNNPDHETVLVTMDLNMQVKAGIVGLPFEDYRNHQQDNSYKGRTVIKVSSSDVIDQFYNDKGICLEDVEPFEELPVLFPNEFVHLMLADNEKKSALGVYKDGKISPLETSKREMYGITPENVGQQFAREGLLRDVEDSPLVILQGVAGSAKTLLSLAAGLQMVEEGKVGQVLLLRPQSFFDKEIGYLPGDEQAKIDPLLRPFYDNLTFILRNKGVFDVRGKINELFDTEKLRAESFTYIRGRSIQDSFIIVDEAQNTTRTQIVGAITRAGQGSKIVLCGDPSQIDNAYVDAHTNGLTFAMNTMKRSDLCYQTTFLTSECRRSRLALDAAQRMA